jgi:hypothetical protein
MRGEQSLAQRVEWRDERDDEKGLARNESDDVLTFANRRLRSSKGNLVSASPSSERISKA